MYVVMARYSCGPTLYCYGATIPPRAQQSVFQQKKSFLFFYHAPRADCEQNLSEQNLGGLDAD